MNPKVFPIREHILEQRVFQCDPNSSCMILLFEAPFTKATSMRKLLRKTNVQNYWCYTFHLSKRTIHLPPPISHQQSQKSEQKSDLQIKYFSLFFSQNQDRKSLPYSKPKHICGTAIVRQVTKQFCILKLLFSTIF